MLCNGVKRESVKTSPELSYGLFCYVPLQKIRYGIAEKKPCAEFVYHSSNSPTVETLTAGLDRLISSAVALSSRIASRVATTRAIREKIVTMIPNITAYG